MVLNTYLMSFQYVNTSVNYNKSLTCLGI